MGFFFQASDSGLHHRVIAARQAFAPLYRNRHNLRNHKVRISRGTAGTPRGR